MAGGQSYCAERAVALLWEDLRAVVFLAALFRAAVFFAAALLGVAFFAGRGGSLAGASVSGLS